MYNITANGVCGNKNAQQIFGGNTTEAHEYPWMAAIFSATQNGLSFRCGGSLISSNLVLTGKNSFRPPPPPSTLFFFLALLFTRERQKTLLSHSILLSHR